MNPFKLFFVMNVLKLFLFSNIYKFYKRKFFLFLQHMMPSGMNLFTVRSEFHINMTATCNLKVDSLKYSVLT